MQMPITPTTTAQPSESPNREPTTALVTKISDIKEPANCGQDAESEAEDLLHRLLLSSSSNPSTS